MRPYVFRAARALELRRTREAAELRARGLAAAAVEEAERALLDGEAALRETFDRGADPHPPHVLLWYRNWIVRQHADNERRRRTLAARRADLESATRRVQDAHRDVRVLERLEARSRAAWREAARREEQKDMDWLGTLGYIRRGGPDEEDR